MAKPATRSYSRYSRDALKLLGQMIRLGRIDRNLTAEELATRAGVSRSLLQRIEKGDPGCAIGAVFEAATIAGVSLFQSDKTALTSRLAQTEEKLALLPKAIRKSAKTVKDDF